MSKPVIINNLTLPITNTTPPKYRTINSIVDSSVTIDENEEWNNSLITAGAIENSVTTYHLISKGLIDLNSYQAPDNYGLFSITTSGNNKYIYGQSIYATELSTNNNIILAIGNEPEINRMAYFGYQQPGTGILGLYSSDNIITYTSSQITLNKPTTINGKLTNNASTTITHYAPIEENIDNYHVGYPVFMSGKVYKQVYEEDKSTWQLSTPTDTTDCICSCITIGNSKTFAGIITSIDNENNSITFATHGDYLFKVDDSSKYNIGDTICYDGSVVDENVVITLAIQQSIIGKVSGIIDNETLAIFKTY